MDYNFNTGFNVYPFSDDESLDLNYSPIFNLQSSQDDDFFGLGSIVNQKSDDQFQQCQEIQADIEKKKDNEIGANENKKNIIGTQNSPIFKSNNAQNNNLNFLNVEKNLIEKDEKSKNIVNFFLSDKKNQKLNDNKIYDDSKKILFMIKRKRGKPKGTFGCKGLVKKGIIKGLKRKHRNTLELQEEKKSHLKKVVGIRYYTKGLEYKKLTVRDMFENKKAETEIATKLYQLLKNGQEKEKKEALDFLFSEEKDFHEPYKIFRSKAISPFLTLVLGQPDKYDKYKEALVFFCDALYDRRIVALDARRKICIEIKRVAEKEPNSDISNLFKKVKTKHTDKELGFEDKKLDNIILKNGSSKLRHRRCKTESMYSKKFVPKLKKSDNSFEKRKHSESEDGQVNNKKAVSVFPDFIHKACTCVKHYEKADLDQLLSGVKTLVGLDKLICYLIDAKDIEGIIYVLKKSISEKMYEHNVCDKGLEVLYFLKYIPELKDEYISVIKFYSQKIIDTDYERELGESALKGKAVSVILVCLKDLVLKPGGYGPFESSMKNDADEECKNLWIALTEKFSDCSCLCVSEKLQKRIANDIGVSKPCLGKHQKKLIELLERRSSKKPECKNKPINNEIPRLNSGKSADLNK